MRISDWISDVVGDPIVDFGALDLRWIGAIVSRDGAVEETGLGAGVLGDPARSVSWLVDRLARYGGRIEAGQTVLSGSLDRTSTRLNHSLYCAHRMPSSACT